MSDKRQFVRHPSSIRVEIRLLHGNPYAGFDANHDGKVTFNEVMQHITPSVRRGFDAFDHNGDGVLSDKDFDEVRDGMQKLKDWLEQLLKPFLPKENSGGGDMHV